MKVENPGGVERLEVAYTIFSKKPIERDDVTTGENSNYHVAEVCLKTQF